MNKCPKCNKKNVIEMAKITIKDRIPGKDAVDHVGLYFCKDCNEVIK